MGGVTSELKEKTRKRSKTHKKPQKKEGRHHRRSSTSNKKIVIHSKSSDYQIHMIHCGFYLLALREAYPLTNFPREINYIIVAIVFHLKKEKAFREYRKENYTVAFQLINSLEDKSQNGIVCYKRAYMYFHGKGIPRDTNLGNELFRQSHPLLGDTPLELFYKGILKKEGRGVEKDYDEAFRLYKKSSEMGFVQAHINLGSCYREGQGCEKDLKMAFNCFKLAADKNSALGFCHVGYMYEFGFGVPLDIQEAIKYYEAAAKKKEYLFHPKTGCFETSNLTFYISRARSYISCKIF